MKVHFMAVALCFVMFLSSGDVYGQTALPQNWDVLKTIPAGERIEVKDRGGKKRKGKFRGVSDHSLELERKGKVISYAPSDVASVWRFSEGSRKGRILGAIFGAAAGFTAAAAITYGVGAIGGDCDRRGDCTGQVTVMAVSIIGFPIAGGVLGAKALGGGDRMLIFSAP